MSDPRIPSSQHEGFSARSPRLAASLARRFARFLQRGEPCGPSASQARQLNEDDPIGRLFAAAPVLAQNCRGDSAQSPEGPIAVKLQRDVQRTTPEFSPALHEKIMEAVDAARAAQFRAAPAALRIPLSAALLAGAIAAMAMLATSATSINPLRDRSAADPLLLSRFVPASHGRNSVRPPVAFFHEAAHEVDVRVQDAVETAMERQQYAGLDHDVRLATRYLMDQAPFQSALESEGDPR